MFLFSRFSPPHFLLFFYLKIAQTVKFDLLSSEYVKPPLVLMKDTTETVSWCYKQLRLRLRQQLGSNCFPAGDHRPRRRKYRVWSDRQENSSTSSISGCRVMLLMQAWPTSRSSTDFVVWSWHCCFTVFVRCNFLFLLQHSEGNLFTVCSTTFITNYHIKLIYLSFYLRFIVTAIYHSERGPSSLWVMLFLML